MNKPMILGVVRHLLTTLGGCLVAQGVVDDAGLSEAAGAVCTLIGVGWSIWEKQQLRKAEVKRMNAEGGARS